MWDEGAAALGAIWRDGGEDVGLIAAISNVIARSPAVALLMMWSLACLAKCRPSNDVDAAARAASVFVVVSRGGGGRGPGWVWPSLGTLGTF